ncbi:hypothetical protein HY412_00205 [Candidatus Kaiserbacteria bacterium]|nr:hypothetical protein [Candidatus Kaiserbacteria bacterium]
MKSLAIILAIVLVAPSAFLVAPHRAQAFLGFGDIVFDPTNLVENAIGAVQSTITAIATPISAAAEVAMKINELYLQPLAFILSGNLLKMITAGVIQFVIGKANGTGIPQFVTDVQQSLQTVSDSRALAFFNQFGRNSNSPFASSITSSLRNDYLSKTSLAGFWARNMNTLARSSPNVNAFLNGNWSQGGVGAWFALTTQIQNNPYTLYQSSQSQLASLIGPGAGGVTGARLAELGWGSGFASWCGANEISSPVSDEEFPVGGGINPGDPCTDADGNPGTIKTPGSVIVASLNKALGSQTDSILRMGNVGPQITSILRDVGTIVSTVNFATQLLGGASLNTATAGLLGSDRTSAANPQSRLAQFAPTTPSGAFNPNASYLGASNSAVYRDAASSPEASSDVNVRIIQYESSWNTIKASANTASTSVKSLIDFCTTAANTATNNNPDFASASRAQVVSAQTALATQVTPVLAQANTAFSAIASARTEIQRVQAELNSSNANTANSNTVANLPSLQTMRPTIEDVARAMQDAQSIGQATADPSGSLTVSGGSLVDRMILVGANAEALKESVCTPHRGSGSDG